ncbi:MAG: hypothetical protein AB1599_01405 [Planctomycetota bacterium]
MENQIVSFDEFKKLDIRIAKVISVENHPNADKLYVLKVDIGPPAGEAGNNEVRQCVAGLRQYVSPERLLNRHIAVVVNLQPAVLRGMESTAMLLAASAETASGREVVLLLPEKELPPGSRVS